jgi:hypothetical protein
MTEQSYRTNFISLVSVPAKRTFVSPKAKIAPISQVVLKLAEFARFRFLLEQNVDLKIAQAVGFR